MTEYQKVQTNSSGIVHACFTVGQSNAVALCGSYIVGGRVVEQSRRVNCPACERRLRDERRTREQVIRSRKARRG